MRRALVLLALLCASCGDERPASERVSPRAPPEPPPPQATPKRILVDQIEIGFQGAQRKGVLRSKEDARKLAESIYERVRSGFDFELLKQEFSDDRSRLTGRANGPYILCNQGVRHRARDDGIPELPYDKMAESWRTVAFSLAAGEAGLAEYHPKKCPWGWHIIRRLR